MPINLEKIKNIWLAIFVLVLFMLCWQLGFNWPKVDYVLQAVKYGE